MLYSLFETRPGHQRKCSLINNSLCRILASIKPETVKQIVFVNTRQIPKSHGSDGGSSIT